MAAPAFQQAYTSSAISAGVMGTLGLFSFLGQAPVVATVIMVFFIAMNLCFLSGFGRLPAHSLCSRKSRAKVRSKERESQQSLLPLSNFFVWITLGLWKDSKTSGENFHHSF